jgi:50S ribosome-binding GTPase
MLHRFLQVASGVHRANIFASVLQPLLPFSTSSPHSAKNRMPPKKQSVEKKTLLGRPSNNLKIGIVGLFLFYFTNCIFFNSSIHFLGLPNVGKSSFFNALSETGALLTSSRKMD